MRITFLLPGSGADPVGGFKVVYEYAGGLAARGHAVTVVHPAALENPRDPWRRARTRARYLRGRITGGYAPRRWFRLHPDVQAVWTPSLDPRHVPPGDAVVATAWETAERLAAYPQSKGRRRLYLIQHLEDWSGPRERVLATWKLPFTKVVIARWLQDIAGELGESAEYIPNGLDFAAFDMDVPPRDRPSRSLLMMAHAYAWKGTADGIAAVVSLRETFPDVSLTLFGIGGRPGALPDWAVHRERPAQAALRELYNRAAIFIAPSRSEGWDLPASESMMCGAALAATDIGGHREYAIHEETALLSPPQRPDLLAANVRRLLEDEALRTRLALAGRDHVRQFTWERAVDRFERVLLGRTGS
jgi:glycosyltransferase involved in cell wall biosynthesis